MNKLTWPERACVMSLLVSAMAFAAPAQTVTILATFDSISGGFPEGVLAQGIDGNLYGTTTSGGDYGFGTVFKMTPAGELTLVYAFTGGTDGGSPYGGLILAPDGNLYGTTFLGGGSNFPDGCGTVFKITPEGALTTLHIFTGLADGCGPSDRLLLAANGNFYGTTFTGGYPGVGVIFEITPTGTLTTLNTFLGPPGGDSPWAPLVQGIDGNLYGTSVAGGTYTTGAVYKMTLSGALTILYSFQGTGFLGGPYGPLALGANLEYYGTTSSGGPAYAGTIFKITPSGTFTNLYNFTGGADQGCPLSGLVQANNGNLYGTASAVCESSGGAGTIFQVTPGGAFTTLYTFSGINGEANPIAGLLQATDGNFYGTTTQSYNGPPGTVFRLSMGLPPLVKAVPHTGMVGSPVIILGSNLAGASRVSFNGTPAVFTVVSSTEVTTTVPAGASTGRLTVTTPSGVVSGTFFVLNTGE